MEGNNPFQAFEVAGSDETAEHIELLRQTQPWLYLMAILMLLGGAMMGLFTAMMALGMGMGAALSDESLGAEGGAVFLLLGLVYGLMTLLYLALGYFLLRQGMAIGELRAGGGLTSLASVFRYQLRFWRTIGVITLLVMVLYCGGIFAIFAIGAALPTTF